MSVAEGPMAEPQAHHIGLEIFPSYKVNHQAVVSIQIAQYLKKLFAEEYANSLSIPSVMELAMFFGCSPLDVLDAFYELRKQGYLYTLNDLYRPVSFIDVLQAKPTKSWWGKLQEFFNPKARSWSPV